MKVLAIDPGGTTGVAAYHGPGSGPTSFEIKGGLEGFAVWWLSTKTCGGEDLHRYLPPAYDIIVIERFILSARTIKNTPQYDALEIVGLVKATSHVHGPPVKLQTAAQAKSFATDEKLKAMKWWDRSPGGHANDAARHLMTYLADTDQAFLQLLAKAIDL